MSDRASAQEIIAEIVRNMRESVEELYSHAVVPSFYQVFLHSADFGRLEPIVPRIITDAKNALDGELATLNRRRLFDRLVVGRARRYEPADRQWQIEFFQDPDEDQPRGSVRIRSQLLLPPRPGVGPGRITRFNVTCTDDLQDIGGSSEPGTPNTDAALAEFTYRVDEVSRVVRMLKPEFLIGRGVADSPVDLVIPNPHVSDVHARVYHVPDTGIFYLENRGRYGTTVNDVELARGTEIRLGRSATIGLAHNQAIVEFRAVRRA